MMRYHITLQIYLPHDTVIGSRPLIEKTILHKLVFTSDSIRKSLAPFLLQIQMINAINDNSDQWHNWNLFLFWLENPPEGELKPDIVGNGRIYDHLRIGYVGSENTHKRR